MTKSKIYMGFEEFKKTEDLYAQIFEIRDNIRDFIDSATFIALAEDANKHGDFKEGTVLDFLVKEIIPRLRHYQKDKDKKGEDEDGKN